MKRHMGWSMLIGLLVVLAFVGYTVQFALKHPSMTLLPTLAANRTGFLQMSPASYKQWGKEVVENMMLTSVASVPFLHAARTYVKGYEHLHGYKIRFETTWLEKP